jgi:hypothetical protein
VTVTDRRARPIDLLHDDLMARAAAEHEARTAADRAAASKIRAAALLEGAAALEALDPAEAALAEQHAWADAAALLRHLAGEAQSAAMARSGQPDTDEETRCVCGDPIQLQDPADPTSWIHSPGSDTPCLNARPSR